jgi:hypothetical protein
MRILRNCHRNRGAYIGLKSWLNLGVGNFVG